MSHPPVLCLSASFGSTSPRAVELIESAAGAPIWRPRSNDWRSESATLLANTPALVVATQTIDEAVLREAHNLRIVAKHGAGVDNIDVGAASRAGVLVANAPGTNSAAVAELVMGLMVALARGIVGEDRRVRRGEWGFTVGRALDGATLGIVGIGQIGQEVAKRAASFGMKLIAYDPAAPKSIKGSPTWQFVTLQELFEWSDFVTLHVPLVEETRRLVGTSAFARMKSTAFLINASRGGVVDEVALDRALEEGEIAGAAIDVFEHEPPGSTHPLVARDARTILTPHMGAYTDRALASTSDVTAENVSSALRGQRPPHALNSPNNWRGGP